MRLKSKRDHYQIEAVKITRTDDTLRVDMKLMHYAMSLPTTGTLVITTFKRPGHFREDAEVLNKREKVMELITTALLEVSVTEDADGYRKLFSGLGTGGYINELYENAKVDVMIDKSKHKLKECN